MQQELLKIIEGCVANVPPQGGRKHPHQEFLQIDTRNILFICGGAFDGIDEVVSRRLASGTSQLGFLAGGRGKPDIEGSSMTNVTPEDLLEFGFIPEMVGRLPVTVVLEPLDKDALVRVLTEPKNAIIRQYQQLFSMDGVDLEFTADALEAVAEQALDHQTGARSLRYIIEDTLIDVMYDLPSLVDAARCIVDRENIDGDALPTLQTLDGVPIEHPHGFRGTAGLPFAPSTNPSLGHSGGPTMSDEVQHGNRLVWLVVCIVEVIRLARGPQVGSERRDLQYC